MDFARRAEPRGSESWAELRTDQSCRRACPAGTEQGTQTWRRPRATRAHGPRLPRGGSGACGHLRLSARETEAGHHRDSPPPPRARRGPEQPRPILALRALRASRPRAAGLRKCVWARPGPGARGRRRRGRRAGGRPGPGPLVSAAPGPARPAPRPGRPGPCPAADADAAAGKRPSGPARAPPGGLAASSAGSRGAPAPPPRSPRPRSGRPRAPPRWPLPGGGGGGEHRGRGRPPSRGPAASPARRVGEGAGPQRATPKPRAGRGRSRGAGERNKSREDPPGRLQVSFSPAGAECERASVRVSMSACVPGEVLPGISGLRGGGGAASEGCRGRLHTPPHPTPPPQSLGRASAHRTRLWPGPGKARHLCHLAWQGCRDE